MPGRQVGVRKCRECGSMHLPGRQYCDAHKCLPYGCPGCQTAGSLDITRDHRAKGWIKAKMACRLCKATYTWFERKAWEKSVLSKLFPEA